MLHACVWLTSPRHGAPSGSGGGLVQARVRVCVPPPQDCEHMPHPFQSDHPPSAETFIVS